jgi:hypothetical protein
MKLKYGNVGLKMLKACETRELSLATEWPFLLEKIESLMEYLDSIGLV